MDAISATIITRNEEQNLERCLNALQGVVDEIIVVDSYSNDNTIEICRRYGCKITQREFSGFGSQRQYAARLTSNNYVLSIDADEVISEDLRSFLIAQKAKGFDHRVYSVMIHNYFCGKPVRHSGYEPVAQVRLFNKRYANWDLRDVADQLTFSDSVTPARLPGTIHHYRCATLQEFYLKENRLASLKAKVLAAANTSISALAPYWHAAKEFIRCHVRLVAWLDGRNGILIARRRARTQYEAYRMARHIINEKHQR